MVMKSLREYYDDAGVLLESRKKVEAVSDCEKSRRALYDLRRQLDLCDQLTGFKYTGRRGTTPATASFQVVDRDVFDSLVESVEKDHGVKIVIR